MSIDDSGQLRARAWLLGTRLDLKQLKGARLAPLETDEPLALAPLTLRVGRDGRAILFRFGAVVFFGVMPEEETRFLDSIRAFVTSPLDRPEKEEAEIRVDPERAERVAASGEIALRNAGVERVQVVADVLAKSTVLAYYEDRVSEVFERVERLAEGLRSGARRPARGRELLREIGSVLTIQARTVGRAEVAEKPEITWDDAELDRLHVRLASEYELHERDVALSRKLELAAHTARTYLDLLQSRQNIRLEWYIVVLIAVEIALFLYDLFLAG
jgi:uncharacterized Rmd1/YagE family protein